MRKPFVVMSILFTFISSRAIFASGQGEKSGTSSPRTATVTFVNVWGGTRVSLMNDLIKKFEQLHPNITVKSELIPQSGMNQRYLTSIAGGTPPDAIMLNRNQLPYFASQHALTSLDPYLKRDNMDLSKIFYPVEVELSQWQGKTYALPNSTATGWALLFWNKKMFAAAGLDPNKGPRTWQDLSMLNAKFLKVDNGQVRQIGLPPGNETSTLASAFYTYWLGSNDGRMLNSNNKRLLIDSPESNATLSWVDSELNRLGGIDKLAGFYQYAAPSSTTEARTAFYDGKAAMLLDGVWMFYQIPNEAPKGFEYGVTTIPYNGANPKAKSSVLIDGGWGYSIPAGAKNAAAAWEWIKYSCAGVGSRDFFEAQARPTPVMEYNKDKWYYDHNPSWDVVIKDAENATFSQPLPVTPQIKRAIDDAVEPALYGKTTIRNALTAAEQAGQKVLDQYWAGQ